MEEEKRDGRAEKRWKRNWRWKRRKKNRENRKRTWKKRSKRKEKEEKREREKERRGRGNVIKQERKTTQGMDNFIAGGTAGVFSVICG